MERTIEIINDDNFPEIVHKVRRGSRTETRGNSTFNERGRRMSQKQRQNRSRQRVGGGEQDVMFQIQESATRGTTPSAGEASRRGGPKMSFGFTAWRVLGTLRLLEECLGWKPDRCVLRSEPGMKNGSNEYIIC